MKTTVSVTDLCSGRRHYRESYISGQNLEERQQLTERLIGDDTNRSAISQNVKKGWFSILMYLTKVQEIFFPIFTAENVIGS